MMQFVKTTTVVCRNIFIQRFHNLLLVLNYFNKCTCKVYIYVHLLILYQLINYIYKFINIQLLMKNRAIIYLV